MKSEDRPQADCRVSLVLPFLNEEGSLPALYNELTEALDGRREQFEFIFVDDGSTDGSADAVLRLREDDPRVHLICFSRNFGHQAAILAGLAAATGQAVICMDSDLQHPPAIVPQLLDAWHGGAQIVQTVRQETARIGFGKRFASGLFYRAFKSVSGMDLPPGAADFRLLDRVVVEHLLCFNEPPFWRAMTQWVGFAQARIVYSSPTRRFGMPKYNLRRNLNATIEALFGYSRVPIAFMWTLAILAGLVALGGIGDALFAFYRGVAVRGWTSQIVVTGSLGCAILSCLAVIATYVDRIHRVVIRRPPYIVSRSFLPEASYASGRFEREHRRPER